MGPYPPEFCGLEWVTGSDMCWSPAGGFGSKAKFLESKEAWQASLGRPACKHCPRLPGSALCSSYVLLGEPPGGRRCLHVTGLGAII